MNIWQTTNKRTANQNPRNALMYATYLPNHSNSNALNRQLKIKPAALRPTNHPLPTPIIGTNY